MSLSKGKCGFCDARKCLKFECKYCTLKLCTKCLMPESHACVHIDVCKQTYNSNLGKELMRNKCVQQKIQTI
jgi:predicted nucleic acid binding AN1-type Zn finger protein